MILMRHKQTFSGMRRASQNKDKTRHAQTDQFTGKLKTLAKAF